MQNPKDYISIIFAYLIVILYVILDNNPVVTSLLIAGLFAYHLFLYFQIKERFFTDKETSVIKLKTRLDKTKKQQEESYKRFISLSTNLGSGLLMIDDDGKIQLSNKDANEFFGRDFNNTDYQDHTDIKSLYKFLNKAYLLEKTLRKQISYHDKNFDLISTPIFEKNLFKGALILVHDITLIKNAEKFQKQFTADVSHELRTPLSAIKGFSEILERDKDIKIEDRIEFISLIKQESARMETILNDLMIISKLDRLDYELELKKYDIKEIIEECVSVLNNAIKEKKLTLKTNIINQKLYLDKSKISQVFLNIIKNAINYTDHGSIEITGEKDQNYYIIHISDTGIGIDEKDLQKIFKRFYRVDKARSRDTGGSGLGLSISKNVVRKHGGTIEVSSEMNKGTTFTIKLPIEN